MRIPLLVIFIASANLCLGIPAAAHQVADTIYTGGPILTIDDDRPSAQAVAVKDGRILAVGDLTELRHPTRTEPDAVSRDVPIMIIHQSGHLGWAIPKRSNGRGSPQKPRTRREA